MYIYVVSYNYDIHKIRYAIIYVYIDTIATFIITILIKVI